VEKRNEASLIKKTTRCATCSRKVAQFVPNQIGGGGTLGDAAARIRGSSNSVPSASTGAAATPSAPASSGEGGSSAAVAGASAAAGAGSVGLGSRIWSGMKWLGRGLGAAGAVALPAVGTYMGAKWIEETINSALSESTEIRPHIRNDFSRLQKASVDIETLGIIMGRMTGISSHVDNHASKVAAVMEITSKEIEKHKKVIVEKSIKNKNK